MEKKTKTQPIFCHKCGEKNLNSDSFCKNCGAKLNKEGIDITNANVKTSETGFDPKKHIKEIKCKCNQCGHIWHYLEEEEKKLKRQSASNAMIGCGMCCNPLGALFLNKSNELSREAEKLKKCPKCNSTDITRTTIYHEKRA